MIRKRRRLQWTLPPLVLAAPAFVSRLAMALSCAALALGCGEDDDGGDAPETEVNANQALPTEGPEQMSFFVTSATSPSADLGGLEGADEKCTDLARAAGNTQYTWQAYLGAENGGDPIHPGSRIGSGPWKNFNGVTVAGTVTILHLRPGDADVFLDENGNKINGQWADSPDPNEHDILTGANPDGTVKIGNTCNDWTSDATDIAPWMGHSDGLGPNQDAAPPRNSWNSAHAAESCGNLTARGGSGRFYCFAIDRMPN